MARNLLKREESYAVHALLNIAENPGTTAAEISSQLEMPAAFMAKVLRKLVNAGFIESKMGRGGGVVLRVEPEEVTLLDVIEGVSGPVVLDACQLKQACVTQRRKGHCNLKVAWISATLDIRERLASVSLAQLSDAPPGDR
ncbi:MAG: Rrf2 family transcriptional regulator [Trueperaceae bacterium]|nr:MAG: Rrf2 family transcriptional regulator [Trueperaceae bacterium]